MRLSVSAETETWRIHVFPATVSYNSVCGYSGFREVTVTKTETETPFFNLCKSYMIFSCFSLACLTESRSTGYGLKDLGPLPQVTSQSCLWPLKFADTEVVLRASWLLKLLLLLKLNGLSEGLFCSFESCTWRLNPTSKRLCPGHLQILHLK